MEGVMDVPSAADTPFTGYSLAERDRRWDAVRANAAKEGLDCVLVPKGNRIDAYYLTQLQNVGFILPTDPSKSPVMLSERGGGNDWIKAERPIRGGDRPRWGPPTAQALTDLGMERARVGVAGLGPGLVSHARAADGVANYSAHADLLRRLPDATFEDATNVVGFARHVKSDEEITCLRRAAAIAEAGIDEMIEVARPGVDEAVLYGRVTGRMMELGGEHYSRARTDWTASGFALCTGPIDGEQPRFTGPPIGRRLQHRTLITNEVSGIWGGMVAQEVQPILLAPIPDAWKPVIELQAEVFQAGLEFMKPGMPYTEFIAFMKGFSKRPGYKTGGTMHGRGMGDDGPLITPRSEDEKLRGITMEAGCAWVWKPAAWTDDGRIEFQWGGSVVLRESGGERLSARPQGMVAIG
jgi:Xaa-Pro dipeptidase